MSKEKINGGDALIRALADENIDLIFGYPGGAALHIYDAIYKQNKVHIFRSARTGSGTRCRWIC